MASESRLRCRPSLSAPVTTSNGFAARSGATPALVVNGGASLSVRGTTIMPTAALRVTASGSATAQFLDAVIAGSVSVAMNRSGHPVMFTSRTPTNFLREVQADVIATDISGQTTGSGRIRLGPNPGTSSIIEYRAAQ